LIQSAGAGKDSLNSLLEALTLESVILMPILRPEMQMVLVAARHQPNPAFGDSDLELLQILASQAMAALENSRLYEKQLEYVRRVEESQRALLQAEKMAAAGRLSASIAHEVGNPLQSVQNCLHLASREDLPEGKRAEYFDMAQKELDRLMGTVSRLLDFYRPGVVSLEKVDLEDMLQYVSNLMGKQLSEANIRVSIDLLGRIPSIAAVAGQIQQVFINLCLNAVDAMPGGGLLRITARPQGGGVEILFQDNGRGIPYDQQSNIFEPFFSTKEGGTGLGLTVSYNIITAHGGTLELLPNQARGACFRIFLPAGECQ
jgi:two-component system NtrC family sensor kinase